MYYSEADRRYHLTGASEGWMEVGYLVNKQKDLEFRWFDKDGDGRKDSMVNYDVAYNWGRPTVHSGGCNLTAADGHVERVSFRVLWQLDAKGEMASRWWYME